MSLPQHEQDKLWHHYQNEESSPFDLSYPRLQFFASRCAPGSTVLNIGVGTGYLETLLVKRGVNVFSLDPSPGSIDKLRERLHMGERAQPGYSQAIPFESGRFDMVIMTEVLEHLSDEVLHPTLEEVRRVLKPGGEFTGSVPYREDIAAGRVLCPRCDLQFHRWGHEQAFDQDRMGRLLAQHRFRVLRMYPRTFADFSRPGLKPLLRAVFRYVLGRMGEPLVGPNLYFRAVPIGPA